MKKLNNFFDMAAFCKGKQFAVKEVKDHYPYVNGEKQDKPDGVTIAVVITKDDTNYGDGDIDNLYEAFNVKCIGADLEEAKKKFSVRNRIRFKRYKKAVVYGSYQNYLSVEINGLDDMEVIVNE